MFLQTFRIKITNLVIESVFFLTRCGFSFSEASSRWTPRRPSTQVIPIWFSLCLKHLGFVQEHVESSVRTYVSKKLINKIITNVYAIEKTCRVYGI